MTRNLTFPAQLIASVLYLLFASTAFSESSGIKKDLDEIKSELRSLREEVSEIKEFASFMVAAFEKARNERTFVRPVTIKSNLSSSDDFAFGEETAPVSIMEFSDYQCGFCARFHKTTFQKLKRKYIERGKVRFIFRDYILDSHTSAAGAASVASCAGEQGKFMEMHEALFGRPDLVAQSDFEAIIQTVPGVDLRVLKKCLNSDKYALIKNKTGYEPSKEITRDMDEAKAIGAVGTPAFFIYATAKPGEELNGYFVRGSQDISVFIEIIEKITGESNGEVRG